MTKTFTYHMVLVTIRPYENNQYLISARIKRKWIEVLTKDKSIYEKAPATIEELSKTPHISRHYAQHIIGIARKKAFTLLNEQYKKL